MRRAGVHIICAVLFCIGLLGQSKIIAPEWVFVSQPLPWHPPQPEDISHRRASADVFVMYPSGRYAAVGCVLLEQDDRHLTMSRGDAFIVRLGTWSKHADSLSTVANVAVRSIEPFESIEVLPTEQAEYTIVQVKGHRQLQAAEGVSYEHLPNFVDFAYLTRVIDAVAKLTKCGNCR